MGTALLKTDQFQKRRIEAVARNQQESTSKPELHVLELLKKRYPDTAHQHTINYYTFDMFVPSQNKLIEVQGNYWHNMPNVRNKDVKKASYIRNNFPHLQLHHIWESEIHDMPDDKLIEHTLQPAQVYVLAGPSGCGKTYLGNKLQDLFDIIDYDKLSFNKCVEEASKTHERPSLLITPMQAKKGATHSSKSRNKMSWGIPT